MPQPEILLIYLFLVRLLTAFLVLTLYAKNRSMVNLAFFISTTAYALSSAFLVFSDYIPEFGALAGIFAVLGIFFILATVMSLVYKIKPSVQHVFSAVLIIFIIVGASFNNNISRFIVLSSQALIVILSLIAVLIKKARFKETLGVSFRWLLSSLISGNIVIGIHLANLLLGGKLDILPDVFTFITSLMLAVFFVQLEFISQNKKIVKANVKLEEEKVKLLKMKNEQIAMLSNISDVVTILDRNANIKYVSPNIEKLFGWKVDELIGKHGFNHLRQDKINRISKDYNALLEVYNEPQSVEVEYMSKDGKYLTVAMTVKNLLNNPDINGVLINFHDVSEQKKLEEEKLQMEAHARGQQVLESIGVFAAGMAHEINNPINGIMNYAQLIKELEENNPEVTEYSSEIISETERITRLVKDLLHFARQDVETLDCANPYDIINRTLPLIKTIMRHDQIEVKVNLEPDLPDIECKSHQIQQVLMNFLTNARDALNSRYSGYHEDKICIVSCSLHESDSEKFIRIMVEDHGKGIDESVQHKIFEPFFTTKERDKGTGLGLSISYGIARDHNAKIWFETKENQYTRFYLDIPVSNQ